MTQQHAVADLAAQQLVNGYAAGFADQVVEGHFNASLGREGAVQDLIHAVGDLADAARV